MTLRKHGTRYCIDVKKDRGGCYLDNQGIVSIIVPVYNVEKYFSRCINSLLSQTYPFLEIILVDDGSPDNCGEMCDDFALSDKRIKVIHKANAGLGMARNTGLDYATGDYIVFVDSDDYVAPEYVEVLLNSLIKHNAEIATAGFIRNFLDGSQKMQRSVTNSQIWYDEEVIEQVLFPILGANPNNKSDVESEMCVWRNIYRRDIIENLQLRFVSEREYVSEDIFFNMQYLLNTHTAVQIPECVYYYSENPISLTHSYRFDRFEKYCAMLLKQIDILQEYYLYEKAKLRLFRTYIMKTKKCISMISMCKSRWNDKRKLCLNILNNELFCRVLKEYKEHTKFTTQRIQLYMLEKKMVSVWMLFYPIKQKIRACRCLFKRHHRAIDKKVVIS